MNEKEVEWVLEEAVEIMNDITSGYTEFCECCGERWSSWIDDDEGEDFPHIYGETLDKVESGTFRSKAYIYRYGAKKPETYDFR